MNGMNEKKLFWKRFRESIMKNTAPKTIIFSIGFASGPFTPNALITVKMKNITTKNNVKGPKFAQRKLAKAASVTEKSANATAITTSIFLFLNISVILMPPKTTAGRIPPARRT